MESSCQVKVICRLTVYRECARACLATTLRLPPSPDTAMISASGSAPKTGSTNPAAMYSLVSWQRQYDL